MGAASCDLPTIGLSGGPMLSGKFRGCDIGSGTGIWQMSEAVRAGEMKVEDFFQAESCMHRSKGHCMTMGTASTMASMVEALGMSLPGNAAIPAVDARRNTLAQMTGRRIVQMVKEDLRMSRILTREAFDFYSPSARGQIASWGGQQCPGGRREQRPDDPLALLLVVLELDTVGTHVGHTAHAHLHLTGWSSASWFAT